MIFVIAAIAIVWTVLAVLILGLCAAARLGDRAEREDTAPAAARPDRHTARHRPWRVRAGGRPASTRASEQGQDLLGDN
ncbi:MAG: hypothetical protein ACLP6E_07030 [Acidimicrobiales bacterium]